MLQNYEHFVRLFGRSIVITWTSRLVFGLYQGINYHSDTVLPPSIFCTHSALLPINRQRTYNVFIFPINLKDNRHLSAGTKLLREVGVTSFLECEFICCELQFPIAHICHTQTYSNFMHKQTIQNISILSAHLYRSGWPSEETKFK